MSRSPGVERTRKHQKHREQVMREARGLCHICGGIGADAIDHIVPVAWGGSDDPRNLAPAHTSCNSRKRDAKPEAWTYNHPSMWLDGFGPLADVDDDGLPTPAKELPRFRWWHFFLAILTFGWTMGAVVALDPLQAVLAVLGWIPLLRVLIPHFLSGWNKARGT